MRLKYREVGRDFPVFLHPDTHEEHALARLERKVAPGYRGFTVEFGPQVTLEEDLARRDLTINAIAQAADGTLLDPHGGRRDLDARVLRHVSPAFVEDPVRVLRVARFAARFAALGFRVAPETLELMRAMVERREVDALVPERVWQETEKALREPGAGEFFRVLRECGALRPIYPEIDALFGVPQPAQWHPEIDTGLHTLMVLDQAALLSPDTKVRFAALVHDLGKGTTPREEWPSHRGHEERSVSLIEALADRLRLPGEYRDLSVIVARYHGIVAPCLRAAAEDHPGIHGARRRVPPPGALRAGAAGLRGGFARPHRDGRAPPTRSANTCSRRATRRPRSSPRRRTSPRTPAPRSPTSAPAPRPGGRRAAPSICAGFRVKPSREPATGCAADL